MPHLDVVVETPIVSSFRVAQVGGNSISTFVPNRERSFPSTSLRSTTSGKSA